MSANPDINENFDDNPGCFTLYLLLEQWTVSFDILEYLQFITECNEVILQNEAQWTKHRKAMRFVGYQEELTCFLYGDFNHSVSLSLQDR